MSSSNQKILRKKVAKNVQDEIFTCNTEIESFVTTFKNIDFNELRTLNYEKLASIRRDIQEIGSKIKRAKKQLDFLTSPGLFGSMAIESDKENDDLPTIYLEERSYKKLLENGK
jgi:hypothetical protein